MGMNNYAFRTTHKELQKVEALLSVWGIFKDGQLRGKITARQSKNNVLHVAFIMFAQENAPAVLGYARMTGAGYPKLSSAIEEIIGAESNRELLTKHNAFFSKDNLMNSWQLDFQHCGFQVVMVL